MDRGGSLNIGDVFKRLSASERQELRDRVTVLREKYNSVKSTSTEIRPTFDSFLMTSKRASGAARRIHDVLQNFEKLYEEVRDTHEDISLEEPVGDPDTTFDDTAKLSEVTDE